MWVALAEPLVELPGPPEQSLSPQFLRWHNEHRFLGSEAKRTVSAGGDDTDQALRMAAFSRVRRLTEVHGDLTAQDLRAGFEFRGERIPLINPQRGIFKPRQMRYLLSIRTVFPALRCSLFGTTIRETFIDRSMRVTSQSTMPSWERIRTRRTTSGFGMPWRTGYRSSTSSALLLAATRLSSQPSSSAGTRVP